MKCCLLAISLFIPVLFVGVTSAAVVSPAMKACGAEWKKEKEAGTVPEGQSWPKFWSQCSKDYAAAHGSADESTTGAPEEPKAKARKTKVAINEDEPSGTSAEEKKACDGKWGSHKAATGEHGWKAYFMFMAKCMP
jgi:hypothetical protein